ncbi:flagellar biosynthesis anti-sigma factor FlgM [Paenalcaligenes niemegkensis]|uniref:flagellar biosynthesis anti-sigma factor FlgM n=1 Tax=Paenalcaligenes niemegkensis TaxID=2895469 RepID=UPI001EE7D990|nr:flagellar biosynthesis anti-sigma factor FlgM [Paenalcaligenes niemegkensis]MCQ9615981.1 flagellar biosynthesis anti-sigma factor FlgM [Paenalcaligenes niemegkensis]
MKVTPNSITHTASERISSTRPSTGAAAYGQSSGTAGGEKAANVDLSSTARQLQQLQSSENDINIEHVQAIKDAIAAGKLKIDTSRIADSLIASARELLK